MKAHNHDVRPRFSPEEVQAQMTVAQELGYENPQELGEAMKGNKELKQKVRGLMDELGFARKGPPKGGPGAAHGHGGGAPAFSEDTGEMSIEDEALLEKLARENGFIKGAEQGDIDAFLAAVRGGQITDPQILSSVGSIAGIDLKDIPGLKPDGDHPEHHRRNALGVSPPPDGEVMSL